MCASHVRFQPPRCDICHRGSGTITTLGWKGAAYLVPHRGVSVYTPIGGSVCPSVSLIAVPPGAALNVLWGGGRATPSTGTAGSLWSRCLGLTGEGLSRGLEREPSVSHTSWENPLTPLCPCSLLPGRVLQQTRGVCGDHRELHLLLPPRLLRTRM